MAGRQSKKAQKGALGALTPAGGDLPFEESVGYQIRAAHRALQRFLQLKIEPYGVTIGMWYFLRVLWNEDGLTQRELSRRVGLMEPTTLTAILSMEKRGLVRRAQNKEDRRRMHVHLTPKGQALKTDLMPLAKFVVATATQGFSAMETKRLLGALSEVKRNVDAALSQFDEIDARLID